MDDRRLSSRIFTLALLAVAAWGALTALGWRYEVKLAPLTTSIIFGGFTLYQFVRAEVTGARARGQSAEAPARGRPAHADDAPPAALVAPGLVQAATAATHVAEEVAETTARPRPAVEADPGVLGPWKGAVWCFAALALVILLGIVIGLPLAIFLLCKVAFRERWVVTLVMVAAVGGLLWIFDNVFSVFWPVGLIFQWLGMY